MGNWSEVCQITNLPILYDEECYVFLVENVNPTQKIPISSGIGAKYRIVCAPIVGNYNDFGGLRKCQDPFRSFKFFQEKSRCPSTNFEDISAHLYENETYHLVWVKKEIFDFLITKPYIVEPVKRDISSLDWDNLCAKALDDPMYAKSKAESLTSYVNIDKNYIWNMMTRFNGSKELTIILSFMEMLRQLRKNLSPKLSTTDEITEIYKDVSRGIMINF